MEYIDTSFKNIEDAIVFEGRLLSEVEEGLRESALCIWQIKPYAVVIGKSANIAKDIFVARCKKDNIKIAQRPSGGGTVLLGNGCLNYSLILPYSFNAELKNINSSYKFLLNCLIDAFGKRQINLIYEPISDLAYNGKKVSGNAQARKKNFLLHHGTFLYDFDINKISLYLKEPVKAPAYRALRCHTDFLANLPLSCAEIKTIIKSAFLF